MFRSLLRMRVTPKGGKRGYHFADSQFKACLGNLPQPSMDELRKAAVDYVDKFNPQTWHDDPQRTMLLGKPVKTAEDKQIKTYDAFKRENGVSIVSGPSGVDQVLVHLKTFVPKRDYRDQARAIEDDMLKNHAGFLIGNQSLDFLKQDGVTELFEWGQACVVERRLADKLMEDEENGVCAINRDPSFVGCVSNFSNFLDLSRKVLRHVELGVPVCVLSRSNTSQHMFRWSQLMMQLMEKHGMDLGMVTYLSAGHMEKQKVMKELKDSPFYITSNRETAANIKKISNNLMSSTGGPNTMVTTELTDKFAEMAALSTMIENSGQCTAMRHLATGGSASSEEVSSFMTKHCVRAPSSVDALKDGKFSALFDSQPFELEDSYEKVGDLPVAIRINKSLPDELDEHWREAYLDVTPDFDFSKEEDIQKLCTWLNFHQPISCAVNGVEPPYNLMRDIFEGSALVVYTMGSDEYPALTAQARPQEAEVFGEFPPRHQLQTYTKFPMVVPSPGPAYHTVYTKDHLLAKAKQPFPRKSLEKFVALFDSAEHRGYAQVVMEYLLDVCRENPKQGGDEWGVSRTVLFGLQRPPSHTHSVIRGDDLNDVCVRLLPFLATNATDNGRTGPSDITVSTTSQAVADALAEFKVATRVESNEDFEKWAEESKPWNILRTTDHQEFSLVGQFASLLFPLGHVKSTKPGDEAFLRVLGQSSKWLKVTC